MWLARKKWVPPWKTVVLPWNMLDFRVGHVGDCEDFFGLVQWWVCNCWRMSGAHNGYMDTSSTDKGAADETDEVDLHVLCLTGEGLTLSVPRSMIGYDLRRLVSQELPCKPGAKLAVHHGNAKLTLNQTLGEQGILEKSAMISCTYIPTNVYSAWRYICGLPTWEGHFVMEGVTRLKAAVPGEYLHHLPPSLSDKGWEASDVNTLQALLL